MFAAEDRLYNGTPGSVSAPAKSPFFFGMSLNMATTS